MDTLKQTNQLESVTLQDNIESQNLTDTPRREGKISSSLSSVVNNKQTPRRDGQISSSLGSAVNNKQVVQFSKSKYNNRTHKYKFTTENFSLEFDLGGFDDRKFFFDRVVLKERDKHGLRTKTDLKFTQINRRNFIYRPLTYRPRENWRRTQGMNLMWDALSAVGGAVSMYYTYQMFSSASTVIDSLSFTTSEAVQRIAKKLMFLAPIGFLVLKYISGTSTLEAASTMAVSILISEGIDLVLVPFVIGLFNQLMPINSTDRHTQGYVKNENLVTALVSLIGAVLLGASTEMHVAKGVMSAIRSLSATMLATKSLEQILITVFECLPDIIHNFLCIKFPALGLYALVSTDRQFKEIIEQSTQLRRYSNLEILFHSHRLSHFIKLRKDVKRIILTDENIDRGVAHIVKDLIDWIDCVSNDIKKYRLEEGKRRLPFVIWLSGEPGIGKSTYINKIAGVLLKQLGYIDADVESMVYSHNTTNKFFDGYHNQPIFVLNDYLQFTNLDEHQWLIRLVDTNELYLDVSSVDNPETGIKGEVRFTSPIIIVTSNATHLSSSTEIVNVDAFNRRRDLVIDMRWKQGHTTVDLENFDYSWVEFKRLNSMLPDSLLPGEKLYNLEQVERTILAHIQTRLSVTEHLNAPESMTRTREEMKEAVAVRESYTTYMKELLYRAYESIRQFLEYEVLTLGTKMGIKLKHLIPAVMIGGTGYYIFKTFATAAVNKAVQSLSGDVTTKRLPKPTRPLTRYTMGYQNNIHEMANKIGNNMVQISTISDAPNGRRIQQTMWGLCVGGTMVVTPKHLWRRGNIMAKDGDEISLQFKGVKYVTHYDTNRIFLATNKDLACYNFLGVFPQCKTINHMLISAETFIEQDGEEAIVVTPRFVSNGKESSVNLNTLPVKAYIADAPYRDEFGEKYEGENIWQYNTTMLQGDCGSVLLLLSKKFEKRIAGLHVAGDSYSGNSEILTKEFYDEALEYFSRVTQGYSTNAEYADDVWYDAEGSLEGEFVFLGKNANPPYQNSETEIRQSPFYEVLQSHLTEPAVLSPSDPRLEQVVSPMFASVAKYGKYIPPFSHELMKNAFRIVTTMYDPIRNHNLRVFDVNDAINAKFTPNLERLDLRTSAGYPWTNMKKTKRDLISNINGELKILPQLEGVINTAENLLSKNTMFPYTLNTTLKDERVSKAKVSIGKTRTFMNFPVEYTILMRRYFDDFIDKETSYAYEIGTTAGVNIYSSKWNILHQILSKYDYTTDGDYKAFDGSIRPEFFVLYSKMVNSFYKDEHFRKRDLLISGCCFAPINVLNEVYIKNKGNPSGSRITTSFNGFVNRMYVVMSILAVLPPEFHTIQFFKDNLKMFVMGDDHLIGFSKTIYQYWNALKLRDFMLQHNIEYTSSHKDKELTEYTPLDNCYFLKSHFVYYNRRYQCGLDKTVIQEMVSWQRDTDLRSTQMIIHTAQRYAFFWGLEYFNMITQKLKDHARARHINITFLYYEDLDVEYNHSDQLIFDYVL